MLLNPLGIALIPDPLSLQQVYRLHQEIAEIYPSKFCLQDHGTLLPHVSLFQGYFPDESMPQIISFLQSRFAREPFLNIKTTQIAVWAHSIFFLDLEKTQSLIHWQQEIISMMEPLRNKQAGSADPQVFQGISLEEKLSIQSFGYPFALSAFRPHFTLGRNDSPSKIDAASLTVFERPLTIGLNRMVLFEVGMYGSLEKIIAEIFFSNESRSV